MDLKERVKVYGAQQGVSLTGAFKNSSATKKLVARLTPAQRRRITKKQNALLGN